MNKRERKLYRKARVKELDETIEESHTELAALKEEEYLERNADMVGQCFRAKYFYGVNNWQRYLQVTDLEENGNLTGWSFERNLKDEIRIQLRFSHKHLDGYEQISSDDFWAEWELLELNVLSHIYPIVSK